MKSRAFGGVPVSEVGLGCWQIGGDQWGDVSDADALEVLRTSVAAGVTFLDTADVYAKVREFFLRDVKPAVRGPD
jgi:aryl-alcohol dehydrogenase-like predicted oxidoreductase